MIAGDGPHITVKMVFVGLKDHFNDLIKVVTVSAAFRDQIQNGFDRFLSVKFKFDHGLCLVVHRYYKHIFPIFKAGNLFPESMPVICDTHHILVHPIVFSVIHVREAREPPFTIGRVTTRPYTPENNFLRAILQ
ncbi:MAG: hypothetical protein WC372_09580 [Candidatus Neomarinimicrobiota bacterium]|jgi:hypothetical protein